MNRDELRRLLTTRGLGRVAGALANLAAPTVGMRMRLADETTIPIGASKVGGCPDLPAGVEWPTWQGPMAFLAQINLAEVAPYEHSSLLPTHGLLSFFAALKLSGGGFVAGSHIWLDDDHSGAVYSDDPSELAQRWRVLFHEADPATFARHEFPPDLDEEYRFRPCTVRFSADVTLPDPDGPQVGPLQINWGTERHALFDILSTAIHDHEIPRQFFHQNEEGGWHLLGHSPGGPTSPLLEAQREAYGLPDNFDLNRLQQSWAWQRSGADPRYYWAVTQGLEQLWCSLLQADVLFANGMYWDGWLYFCIEREALARRDFARAWLINEPRP